jgi:NADH:ubiquinone reductase (H+-translocating)
MTPEVPRPNLPRGTLPRGTLPRDTLSRVVIIGAGFAGLWAAQALARSRSTPVDILLLDSNNYHTFLPLLYQVASAELEPEDIVYPVRSILRKRSRERFLMERVTEIDLASRQVKTADHSFSYDYLILAAGSASYFFGVPGAAENAFELKTLEQGIALRNHILFHFERALCETDPQRRKQMLTFAIVGGGPTGVELAGALAELIRGPVKKDYPGLDLREVKVVLLESSGHLLASFPAKLQNYALEHLRQMGVDVRLGSTVSLITPQSVELKDGNTIPTETAIWTAGVHGASPAALGLPIRGNGQVTVLPSLEVEGYPHVYVTGDLAHIIQDGALLPMVAPVAIQEGKAAAENVLRQMNGLEPLPFRYHDPGNMVTLGRNAAVAQIGSRSFTGFVAWVLWLSVHLFNLIGYRNRILVLFNWGWDYLFYERAVRLIIPSPERNRRDEETKARTTFGGSDNG